jgi:PhnB protein
MKVSVHLSFNGTCEEAFATYTRLLNGTMLYSLSYRDSPMSSQGAGDWQDKLYHATIEIGGVTVLGGDHLRRYHAPQAFPWSSIRYSGDARGIFDGLADAGTVQMPLQATFWSAAFGVS